MRTEFFTVGIGPHHAQMTLEMIPRFFKMNGAWVTPISRYICQKYGVLHQAYWIKAFLWDLAHPSTERVCWVDGDMLPVAPLEPLSEAPFAARRDIPWTSGNERLEHFPLFSNIREYFNNGFFTATRDAMPAFELLKKEVDNPIHGTCIEQTWMNKHIDETVGLTEYPRRVAYMVDAEDEPQDTRNRHYACLNKYERFMSDLHLSPL